ncbi:MAG TPA: tetratricopeptide repeat protein [Candidatus Limnocylindrales bacterium]
MRLTQLLEGRPEGRPSLAVHAPASGGPAPEGSPRTSRLPRSSRLPRRALAFLAAAVLVVLLSQAFDAITRTGSTQVASEPRSSEAGLGTTGGMVDPFAVDIGAGDDGRAMTPAADVGATTEDPDGRLPVAERLAFWAERVRRNPTDHLSLVQLAALEAQEARRTQDISGLMRADALLDEALAIDPASFQALRVKAGVQFSLHDFRSAVALADSILAIAADDVGALAVHADASLELGDLGTAATEYERLSTLASGPAVDARRARLAFLQGDETSAIRLATAARDAAFAEAVDDAPFYDLQLADLARLTGDADAARAAYGAGLGKAPDDVRLLVGLARLNAATGDDDAAIAGLRRATAIVPTPDALALLGDLLAARGDTQAATTAFATIDAIATLSASSDAVYDRQLALIALDRGEVDAATVDGLRTALRERPDAFGHDLLAWALHLTGDAAGARAEIDAALASGIHDARIVYHAGAIALTVGDDVNGRAWLTAALARSTALTPAEQAEATRLLEAAP